MYSEKMVIGLIEYATGKAFRPVYIWQDFLQYIQDECHAYPPRTHTVHVIHVADLQYDLSTVIST